MTSDYNNLIYDTSKNEAKSMQYLLTNYKSPITETKYVEGKIITTEYGKNINTTDNYTSNPISSYTYTYTTNVKDAQVSSQKAQNKYTTYYETTTPLRMSYELSEKGEDINKNNEDIFSYKVTNEQKIINPTTYVSANKHRARSPGIIRNNNYLLNYYDTTANKKTNYSRSPGPSFNQKNNIYSSTPIRYVEYKYVTPTLVYPNNIKNIQYVPLNNELVQTYYVTNNIPAYSSNNVRYYTSIPVTPSNKNFLNTVTSGTYQTIPISSPYLSSSTKNINYNSSIPKFSTTAYGKNNTYLYGNNLLTPSKSNSIYNQINSASNKNTFQTSNKSNQTNSFMPNSYGTNSSPSSERINLNNYNSLSSKKGENNLGRNQNDGMENPHFYSERKNLPLTISNFDKNKITHLCSEEKDSSSIGNFKKFVKKNLKNFDNSSHKSGSDASSSGIPSILYSNGKKYLKKKLENKIDPSEGIEEEVNTNINKYNNNINNDIVSTLSNSKSNDNSNYSFDNNNQNYLCRQTQIRNYPSDYFSQYMFEHINQIRNNPKKFIQIIKESMNNIGYNRKGNLIYRGDLKVALYKGKLAFEEAIDSLRRTEPMNPLIFKGELCVDIPQKEKDFKSGDYLRKEIREKISSGIIIRAFWRDIIKDPKINFILMIVDDNPIRRGDKRKDILDPKMKYIGINSGTLGDSFVCYTVLSNE